MISWQRKSIWLVLIALAVGLSASCAPMPQGQPVESVLLTVTQENLAPIVGTAVEGGSPGQPLATATQAATVEGARTITQSDNGGSFVFKPAQRFILILDEGYDWEITIAEPQVVNQVSDSSSIKGSQGAFEALQPGQTELSASGDPLCRKEKPACMRPTILFSITIVVE